MKLRVIICEDDHIQNQLLFNEISKYAMFHEPSIEIVLCAKNPYDVLTYIEKHKVDCYFLDIELNTDIDGLDLASEIRKTDPLATIIFITTHADRLKLTFKYKLAALDFIVKDTPEQISLQIKEALQVAFLKYKQIGVTDYSSTIQIQIGSRVKNIHIQDIYYIETSPTPHKLTLYERNGFYEFYGKLKDFEALDTSFYRCHKSYFINLHHVKEFNKKQRTVTMTNGGSCEVSFRAIQDLGRRLNN